MWLSLSFSAKLLTSLITSLTILQDYYLSNNSTSPLSKCIIIKKISILPIL